MNKAMMQMIISLKFLVKRAKRSQKVTTAYLEVSGLGHKPAVDELLRVFGKSKKEVAVHLELINGLNRLMNLQQQN